VKALLLAAGEGTRLRPFTLTAPKPMVPLGDEPVVAWSLTWLRENGITDVAINVHYKPEPLVEYVGDGSRFGLNVTFSHETELLGSSGALVPLRGYLAGEREFVVLYGDVLTDLDLRAVIDRHRVTGADFTMVLTHVDDPTRAGIAELDDRGWIGRFKEKPARAEVFSSWANAGVYICGPRTWQYLPKSGHQDFGTHVVPAMIADGAKVLGFTTDATVVDIGSPERLAEATALAADGVFTRPPKAVQC
jgi:mannose-1-phosphate guanylyltransferase